VKIQDFYEKLFSNVQALETLGKLREISGYVQVTIDKLVGIRGDLVRTDNDWQEWEFPQLVLALRKWTERNPQKQDDSTMEKPPLGVQPFHKSKTFQAKQQEMKSKPCVYCDESRHRPSDCSKVASVAKQKKVLVEKQLCWYQAPGFRMSQSSGFPILQTETSFFNL